MGAEAARKVKEGAFEHMNIKELYARLKKLAPTAYMVFRSPQTPPYICYYIASDDRSGADCGGNYVSGKTLMIELYTAAKDIELEQKLEQIINGFDYAKYEAWIPEDKLFQVAYEIALTEKI